MINTEIFQTIYYLFGSVLYTNLLKTNMSIRVYIENIKYMNFIYRSVVSFFSNSIPHYFTEFEKKNLKKQFKRKRVFGEFNYGSYS